MPREEPGPNFFVFGRCEGSSHLADAVASMSSLAPKLVFGLGNPGEKYSGNRHNAGYMVVDRLAAEFAAGAWQRQCQSLVCRFRFGDASVVLAKPLTFMNRSGEALGCLIGEYRLAAEDVILILDDFNLPFGRLRIRMRGSAGGHNGLESVIRALGTQEVIRVRLGIGEESMPDDKAGFVLEDFRPEQNNELKEMITRAGDAVKTILSGGVAEAMSLFNG